MEIKKLDALTESMEDLIGGEFSKLAASHHIKVGYEPFYYAAFDGGEVIGLIMGHAYYNEVHVENLVLLEKARGKRLGTQLLKEVELSFKDKGYDYIALSTYGFQAPDFYLKQGFEVEFVREHVENPKLNKIFLRKLL